GAPGAYDVALTVFGLGGQDVEEKSDCVSVSGPGDPEAPRANFTVDRTAGNAPLTVSFSDRSTGDITQYQWNFGDGSTSTRKNPSHIYTAGGVYSVSLTVTGPAGTHAITQSGRIVVNVPNDLDVDFTGTPLSGTAPLIVRFRGLNLAGVALTGTFDFGDGATASVGLGNGRANHTYTVPGVYTVTLTAHDLSDTDIEQKVGYVTVK